ncbi:Uncharacterized protein OBRU01_24220 [Operophtera brumata]|uniref:DDE Tnp4 domain-containing protein n=1 Tax=Operophtera brumata TaxID=104452 RepID=A0A0L7KP51_OPEBR|nr:Uncharacterized protein OBRU01_24220 [Operophtera brumata]
MLAYFWNFLTSSVAEFGRFLGPCVADSPFLRWSRCSSFAGDSGYALRPWMMTPLVETTPNTPEDRYNDTQKKMRATVERCNGVIKQRFRCLLKDRVLHYTPQKANKIINACVVLHNMCVEADVPLPPNSGENITEEQLGMLPDRPPPALPPNSRTNRYLNMGRTKQTNIINQYFNLKTVNKIKTGTYLCDE